jgi:hypothetical protein
MTARKKLFIATFVAGLAILAVRPAPVEGALAAAEDEAERIETSITVIRELVELPEVGVPEALLHKPRASPSSPASSRPRTGSAASSARASSSSAAMTGAGAGRPSSGFSEEHRLADRRPEIGHHPRLQDPAGPGEDRYGRITLGADIGVSAGPVGRRAEASTDRIRSRDLFVFPEQGALRRRLDQGGATQVDEEANEAFYGRKGLDPHEILAGRELKAPDAAAKLREVVATYTSDRRRI